MKKVMIMLAMLTMTLAASAQFEKGNTYVDASVTGLGLSYNGREGFRIGIDGQIGVFIKDNWSLFGRIGYDHIGATDVDDVKAGVGGRYYFQKNGIFLGAHIDYIHATPGYNDCMPGIEAGYCFFLSHEVAIEPAIYYNQSFQNHSDYSTVGLKVGISLFHKKKQLTNAVKEAFEEDAPLSAKASKRARTTNIQQ